MGTNWTGDLTFGQLWEAKARLLLSSTEEIQQVAVGMFKAWDFRTNVAKYEVKADRLAYKYGGKTMFIEHSCSGKPSGIASTEADYWIYFMVKPSGEFAAYRIPVAELKKACDGCVVKAGGDGYRSRGYIVPVMEQFRMPQNNALTLRIPASPPSPQSWSPKGNTSPGSSV